MMSMLTLSSHVQDQLQRWIGSPVDSYYMYHILESFVQYVRLGTFEEFSEDENERDFVFLRFDLNDNERRFPFLVVYDGRKYSLRVVTHSLDARSPNTLIREPDANSEGFHLEDEEEGEMGDVNPIERVIAALSNKQTVTHELHVYSSPGTSKTLSPFLERFMKVYTKLFPNDLLLRLRPQVSVMQQADRVKDALFDSYLKTWEPWASMGGGTASSRMPIRASKMHQQELLDVREALCGEYLSNFVRQTPGEGLYVRPSVSNGLFCWVVDLWPSFFSSDETFAWVRGGKVWRFVMGLLRLGGVDVDAIDNDETTREDIRRYGCGDGKAMMRIEVRFGKTYPRSYPFVRVVQPRVEVVRSDGKEDVTFGGVVLSTTDSDAEGRSRLPIESFRTYIRNVAQRWIKSGIRVVSRPFTLADEFEEGLDFEIDEALRQADLEYDEDVAKVDFRRFVRLQKTVSFSTARDYSEELIAIPPIFHFPDNVRAQSMENGNKIMLPPTAAEQLFRRHRRRGADDQGARPDGPLLFEIMSERGKLWCGVREFTATASQTVIPHWMFKPLVISQGERVTVRCVELPTCTSITLMPVDPMFFRRVRDHKTLLESSLKNFFALAIGDIIPVKFGNLTFDIFVMDCQPKPIVSIMSSSGYTECSVVVLPPKNFDPRIHKPARTAGLDALPVSPVPGGGLLAEFEAIEDPVSSPTIVEGRQYERCSNCGHRVVDFNLRRHETHCQASYARCEHCQKLVPKDDLEEHNAKFHEIVPCPQCTEMFEALALASHMQNECPLRIVYCEYLGCPVAASQLEAHQEQCGSQTEMCPKCREFVYLKDKAVHSVSCLYGGTTRDATRLRRMQRDAQRAAMADVSPTFAGMSSEEIQMARALEASMMASSSDPPTDAPPDAAPGTQAPPPPPFQYIPTGFLGGSGTGGGHGGGGGGGYGGMSSFDQDLARAIEMSMLQSSGSGSEGSDSDATTAETESPDPAVSTIPMDQDFVAQAIQDALSGDTSLSSSSTGAARQRGGSDAAASAAPVPNPVPVPDAAPSRDIAAAAAALDGGADDGIPKCPVCNDPVGSEAGLVDHVFSVHGQIEETVTCPFCRNIQRDFVNHIMLKHLH